MTTYWITRKRIIQLLGVVYAFHCFACFNQLPLLVGHNGLLPLHRVVAADETFDRALNLFTLMPRHYFESSDAPLQFICLLGAILGAWMAATGGANVPMMLTLFVVQSTIKNVGQLFTGYGWEIQLLETTFLCAFLVPLWCVDVFRETSTPSKVAVWLLRLLLFRIMIGAGMIKLRGDACWRDLTCMQFHYETQPIPNPVSLYLHAMAPLWHGIETLVNHAVELGLCICVLMPIDAVARFGAIVQLGFQLMLAVSGNLSFLNWLTMVPALAALDDGALVWLSSSATAHRWRQLVDVAGKQRHRHRRRRFAFGRIARIAVSLALLACVLYMSVAPLTNVVAPGRQTMNRAYDRYSLVNAYGAFGSITKQRHEVIVEGRRRGRDSPWLAYEFPCKPGNVMARPCIRPLYQTRIAWQLWFAAFQRYEQNGWLLVLVSKLLRNNPTSLALLSHNPFADGEPPSEIRVHLYRYWFNTDDGSDDGAWYRREFVRNYLPVPSLSADNESLRQVVSKYQ
jgi:lipase maturation factor 1